MRKSLGVFCLTLLSTLAYSQKDFTCQHDNSAAFMLGFWVGDFHQYSCGLDETYPMTLEITHVDQNKFSGFFIWNSISSTPSSKTTLEGELVDNKLFLYEKDLVEGSSNIVLNGTYEIDILDCGHLKGIWRMNSLQEKCNDPKVLEDGGSFLIKKLEPQQKAANGKTEKARSVSVKGEAHTTSEFITVKLWDNQKEDGDIINLKLNGNIALENYTVAKNPKEIILPLLDKENVLELYALNLGSIPPNTAAIAIMVGGEEIKRLILVSDMNTSGAIKIIKDQ